MIKQKTYIFFLLFIIATKSGFCQDVSFSQFYANPLNRNPAFAGSIGVPRVAIQYRSQWHNFDNAYNTYSAAFDMPVEKLKGGIGFNFINDAQAGGALNSYQMNAAYSVNVRLSEDYTMYGGLQAGLNQKSLKTDGLVFSDNLDPNFGNHGVSGELANLTDPNYSFVDFSTGVLVFSKRFYFGLAAHHLTEPNQSFIIGQESNVELTRKYTVHIGAQLPVYLYGHRRKKFDVSPKIILQKQGDFEQINYGMFIAKRGLAAGAWFRQNFGMRYDAIIFLVGFVRKRWQFTYTYDMTVSGLWGNTGGTSEVSLGFLLRSIKKGKVLPFYDQYDEEFGEM